MNQSFPVEIPLQQLTVHQIAEMIRSGSTSAEALATLCLDYAEATEASVHAFAYLNREAVLMQARLLDEGRGRGGDLGRLSGVPLAIKDVFDTFDMPTEYGSKSLSGRQPRWDATAVRKLREAGAIIFGKTKLPDFCLGQAADTRNPHHLDHTPGGSSSGSAAAVAAGMTPVAIGSQTVGSVIRPASFCGIIGFKPTRGLISRAGVQPLSETLDQIGVFGRNIEDIALVSEVLIGADEGDPLTRGVLPRQLLTISQLVREAIEKGEADFDAVARAIQETGALEHASRCAVAEAALARQAIELLPDSPARQALIDFCTFAIERDR